MVVACRTQQLIKSSKNVTISKKKLQFANNYSTTIIRNTVNSNKNLVPLSNWKKWFHSRESRSILTKLTPQEVINFLILFMSSI